MNQQEAKEYFWKTMQVKGVTDDKEIESYWNMYLFKKGMEDAQKEEKSQVLYSSSNQLLGIILLVSAILLGAIVAHACLFENRCFGIRPLALPTVFVIGFVGGMLMLTSSGENI